MDFIVIFHNRPYKITNFCSIDISQHTLQNLSHGVQISGGDDIKQKTETRQNEGPQIMSRSYFVHFVTAGSLIEQNPELGFAASV